LEPEREEQQQQQQRRRCWTPGTTLILEPRCVREGNERDEMPGSRPIHKQTGESDPGQTKKRGSVLGSPWVKAERREKGAMEKEKEKERRTTRQRI
jgi:hypothetical protein